MYDINKYIYTHNLCVYICVWARYLYSFTAIRFELSVRSYVDIMFMVGFDTKHNIKIIEKYENNIILTPIVLMKHSFVYQCMH